VTQPLPAHGVVAADAAPALVRADQPSMDAQLASRYNSLPFAGDLPSARLVQADVRNVDLGTAFDLAIATKSFAHLVDRADQADPLSRIARHPRPGGLLVLDVLHPEPAWVLRQHVTEYAPSASRLAFTSRFEAEHRPARARARR
jgi:SAM-dependent methyltransferase